MSKRTPLAEKLDEVKDRIAAAAIKAKRDPAEITLVAVTKTAAPEQIREIMQLGIPDLGESRVQVLLQRAAMLNEFLARKIQRGEEGLPPKLHWHMIGHLQRNKAKHVLPLIHLIHSVDSLRLAEELESLGAKMDRKIPVLMQLNASEETTKYGVAVGAAVHLGEQIDSMPHLQFTGLMTMAPLTEEESVIRQTFARTREVFEEMKWHKIGGSAFRHLSMGMSHDYELAVAEGATMLRIGTALFGGNVDSYEESEE
jgi:PLP dependent protein